MKISDEIIKVLDALCEKFGIAIDWTSQNVLPYLEQLGAKIINYELLTSILWIIIYLLPIFIVVRTFCKVNKHSCDAVFTKNKDGDYDYPTVALIVFVIAIIPSIIGCIVIVIQLFDIFKCLVFPEKVVFDFVKSTGLLK